MKTLNPHLKAEDLDEILALMQKATTPAEGQAILNRYKFNRKPKLNKRK